MVKTPLEGCGSPFLANLAAPSMGQPFLPVTPITAQLEERSGVREKISAIKADVCQRHGITEEELIISPYRARRLARARFEAAFLLRMRLGLTLSRIGKALGGRSVRTIRYCIEKWERIIAQRAEGLA